MEEEEKRKQKKRDGKKEKKCLIGLQLSFPFSPSLILFIVFNLAVTFVVSHDALVNTVLLS